MREAFKYNPDTWDGRDDVQPVEALEFPLDTPWKELPEKARDAILYGIDARRSCMHDAAGREGRGATSRKGARSGFTASRGASSGTTAATGSAARRTRGWKRGSTR